MRRKLQLMFYGLHRIFPRFKFWRICKAMHIKPHPWQKAYALGQTERLPRKVIRFRATGKTTAVMLRLLMVYPGQPFDMMAILRVDHDFDTSSKLCLGWYEKEYRRLAWRCYADHIPVMTNLRIYELHDQFRNRRR